MSGPDEVWWFLGVVLSAGAMLILASLGFGSERRAHFVLRIVLLCLVPLSVVLVARVSVALNVLTGSAGVRTALLLLLGCLPPMALVPRVLYWRSESSPTEGTDGGDPVPDRPSSPPGVPSGALPLPNADQSHWRVRDHVDPDRLPARPRRPSRQPEPTPGRVRSSAT